MEKIQREQEQEEAARRAGIKTEKVLEEERQQELAKENQAKEEHKVRFPS